MGSARRDREQPHRHPDSATEMLYYRALLGRVFLDTDAGPEEFAYVPDELLPRIPSSSQDQRAASICGRPATAAERAHVLATTDRILDEATTRLAALRSDRGLTRDAVLGALLEAAGILKGGIPQAENVRAFLETTRADALRLLAETWTTSASFNELRLVPSLVCEGTWKNDPKTARTFLLNQMHAIPIDTWWSLEAFVSDIKKTRADFQRAAGDYDSWFIKSAEDGRYLRGFENWDRVEGAWIRFVLVGVMHRLALLDLAVPGDGRAPSAFRLAAPAQERKAEIENGKLHISSQGRITATRRVPRAIRYQLARFCEWAEQGPDEYRFHLSPRSLEQAATQGLRVEHLLNLLAKHGDAGIPAAVAEALHRWDKTGTEARTESQVLLRVSRPEIIQRLQDSKGRRFLGQTLGPTTVVIKPGAQEKVIAALAELGILAQEETEQIETAQEPGAKQGGPAKSGAKPSRKK